MEKKAEILTEDEERKLELTVKTLEMRRLQSDTGRRHSCPNAEKAFLRRLTRVMNARTTKSNV